MLAEFSMKDIEQDLARLLTGEQSITGLGNYSPLFPYGQPAHSPNSCFRSQIRHGGHLCVDFLLRLNEGRLKFRPLFSEAS